MLIISHRGYWKTPNERNLRSAFSRSFSLGFGTETDFRDLNGELVISHDPPITSALSAKEMLDILVRQDRELPLAINIKSDGLQMLIKGALEAAGVVNYFLFDMSVPDAIQSIKAGLNVYTRHSDVEHAPVLYEQSCGVWMDAFYDHSWITPIRITQHLESGKDVCLVSPELHRRNHCEFWETLAESNLPQHPRLTLCTDIPEEARKYFQQ